MAWTADCCGYCVDDVERPDNPDVLCRERWARKSPGKLPLPTRERLMDNEKVERAGSKERECGGSLDNKQKTLEFLGRILANNFA